MDKTSLILQINSWDELKNNLDTISEQLETNSVVLIRGLINPEPIKNGIKKLIENYNISNDTHLDPKNEVEDWRIDLVDTGQNCMTGGRIARAYDRYYQDKDTFGVTYGDGICDVNLRDSFDFHKKNDSIGTITGVNPTSRFGELKTNGQKVEEFLEKPVLNDQWINGGYFFFNSNFRNFLTTDTNCILEQSPLKSLSENGELQVFKHSGFWRCMDTQRDKEELDILYKNGEMDWLY